MGKGAADNRKSVGDRHIEDSAGGTGEEGRCVDY